MRQMHTAERGTVATPRGRRSLPYFNKIYALLAHNKEHWLPWTACGLREARTAVLVVATLTYGMLPNRSECGMLTTVEAASVPLGRATCRLAARGLTTAGVKQQHESCTPAFGAAGKA